LGVPHTEVGAILINGKSVNFTHLLKEPVSVEVYPDVDRCTAEKVIPLKPRVPSQPKFVLDVHLGKLANFLRLGGFDSLYSSRYTDHELVQIGMQEKRLILTRDIGLLKNKNVKWGYFVRHTNALKQFKEIIRHYALKEKLSPFKQCMTCNGCLRRVTKKKY